MFEPAEFDSYLSDALISSVQNEWNVFSEGLHESGESAQLLADILNSDWDDDDGESPVDPHDLVSPRQVLGDAETWETLCSEVYENPDAPLEFSDVFEEDLSRAIQDLPAGKVLYRARRGWSPALIEGRRKPYSGADIGAPPPVAATPGRANREGRSVLYCAEDEETSVAEVRPARGFWVSTCQLRLRDITPVLDLVDGIPIPNPFTNESLAWYSQFTDLLASFSEVLSTPLARSDDIHEYTPSQKLCEYVERLGYAGVRFPSAMQDNGVNVVFFDTNVAEILDSRLVEVTSLKIGFHER